jgi:hypothetical protein
MMQEGVYLESLIGEYEELLQQSAQSETALAGENLRLVTDTLCRYGDWSEQGADEITRLATDYGAFMLRNALAIAIVLGKEDGEIGF